MVKDKKVSKNPSSKSNDSLTSNKKNAHNSNTLYWSDLNKTKFISLVTLSSWSIRTTIHPFILIKTRMQCVQQEEQVYKNIYDAGRTILKKEGLFKGLFRGYTVAFAGIILAEPFYFAALETTREKLDKYWKQKKNEKNQHSFTKNQQDLITSIVAGGISSVVQYTILGMTCNV
ncbi:unnamed protein product [Didymodactylos carnosus]|uniref:Mitochondrial carrier protein n=1 Tax=Didymodactylos carnosus TaxID=1234261 RepID=A0A8S2D9B0_9BILA|nr:unnamed protein product [Didymodactylos carnosus]CAF3660525.1 unnamed protein product [Didymodactylos carnosus]